MNSFTVDAAHPGDDLSLLAGPIPPPRTKPPAPPVSPTLAAWEERIRGGWRPNKRIRKMDTCEAAAFFEVTPEEYVGSLWPLLNSVTG